MLNNYFKAGALLAGLGVILGAFGAHELQDMTNDERIIHAFNTGVQYQLYHSLALVVVALVFERRPVKWLRWAGFCFFTGIVLFSGSLYLITILKLNDSHFAKLAGPLTPLGGILFIAGWLFFFLAFMKKEQ